jgi:hypothetical protein
MARRSVPGGIDAHTLGEARAQGRLRTPAGVTGAPASPGTNLVCEECGMAFGQERELERHARGHREPPVGVEPDGGAARKP